MPDRTKILALAAIAFVAACDRTSWPPSRAQMAQTFEAKKETFVELEREMASDGLLRMSPGVFSEMERNPAIPRLPSAQMTKYLGLFERAQMFVSVVRHEESTEFEMMIENVGPRLYLPRFVHSTNIEPPPRCSPRMHEMACGSCSIYLETHWMLEYSWFPAKPDDEARLC